MTLLKYLAIFGALILTANVSYADDTIQGRLEHVFGEDSFGKTVINQYFIRTDNQNSIPVPVEQSASSRNHLNN